MSVACERWVGTRRDCYIDPSSSLDHSRASSSSWLGCSTVRHWCCLLTFDPANMPFQNDVPEGSDTFRWQLWEEIAQVDLAENMGQGKIPWYTHRLIHRKRVTSELHDSYFRLMTIKHAIPKIEWAIELLYNSVETGSQWVVDQRGRRQNVGEKATTQQKESSGLSLEIRPVGEKMLEWEHFPERLGPQDPGWAAQGNENDTQRCPEGLVRSIRCSLCSVHNSLSHATFQIKWEVYFLMKSSLVFIHCVNMYSACICVYLHIYYVEYTRIERPKPSVCKLVLTFQSQLSRGRPVYIIS